MILLVLSAVIIFDATRIGFGWLEGQGPAPGYFPFWIAVLMGGASLVNLFRAVTGREKGGDETFITRQSLRRVLTVLVPTAIYVLAIQFFGIYIASIVFIAAFMVVSGEPIWKAAIVGIGVPIALYFMFEKWFLVPLPKGPIEAMLGL